MSAHEIVLCEANEEYSHSDPGRRVVVESHTCPDMERTLEVIRILLRFGLEHGQWLEIHPG